MLLGLVNAAVRAGRKVDESMREILHELRTTGPSATGYTDTVRALAVAPDGSWLTSAGDDGQVRIWDPTTAAPLTSLRLAGSLFHLALATTTIAAAGECGPYFLAFCRGIQPEQGP